MKQQQLFKRFSIRSLLVGFLALGLFILSCEEDSNSSKKANNSLALHYKANKDGSYEFYVKNFTKDGEVVFEDGSLPEQIKELLREYWKKSHVRWGIREKTSGKKETKIYWIQKNSAYKNFADKIQYQIEAPEGSKDKFIPTDLPAILLQKSIDDIEVVASVSNDGFKILNAVALPADFKRRLLQATEIYGQVRNKTAIDAGLSGTDIIIPEATIYITHEDTGTIFHGRSDAQGNYNISVRFGGDFSLSALKAGMQPFSDTLRIRLADDKREIRDQNIDMLELSKGTTVKKNQLYDISGGKLTALTGSSSGLSVSGKTVSSADGSAVADATLIFYKKDTKTTYMLKSGADGTFSMNLPTAPGIGDNDETQLIFSASATGYTFEKVSIVLGKGGSVSSQLKVVELTPIASGNSGSNKGSNTGGKVKLSTPASVRSTNTSSSSITVEWAQVTNASGYGIYYAAEANFPLSGEKQQGGLTVNVAGFGKKDVSNGATTSAELTGLQADSTYYFKVVAKGSGKYTDSDASTEKSATTGKTKLGTPTVNTPSGVAITATSISLSWNAVTNASGYEVHYSTTSGFAIGGTGVTKVTVNSGRTTSQSITGLTANTSYYFKVVAKGGGSYSDSDASTEKSATTGKTKLGTPTVNTPSGVAITATSISLSWNAVTNASGYEVHYSTTSGFAIGGTGVTKVTVNSGRTTSQSITGLTANTSYYFKVVAKGSGSYSDSDASTEKSATTGKTKLGTPRVNTPSGVAITATSISLSWNAVTNASGYEVHYSTTSGFAIGGTGVTKVTINNGRTTSQSITSLTANTSYYFKVVAKGGGSYIDSDASAQKTVKTNKTKLGTPRVNTPSGAALTDTSISLSWNAVTNASGYEVHYSTTNGFAIGGRGVTKVTINNGRTTSQSITSLTANTSYYFKVVAKGGGAYSDSDASAQKTAKTNKTKLGTPRVNTPSGAVITDTSISLSWSAVANASGYEVHYSTTNGFAIGGRGVSKRTINNGRTTSQRFTGLTRNTSYYFKVVAKGSGSYSDSDASAQKAVRTDKTKLGTPVSVRTSNVEIKAITVSWSAVANASRYELYGSTDSTFNVDTGRDGIHFSTFNVNGTSQNITGLASNTSYYFKVRAIGSGNYINSDASSQVSAATKNNKLATPTWGTVRARTFWRYH